MKRTFRRDSRRVKNELNWWKIAKGIGATISAGLLNSAYSRARSHYCPTRELLAARFPIWPVSLLVRQPGSAGLLQPIHVDARLSADTCSTQATIQQDSQLQAVHYTKPPRSRITGTCHVPSYRYALWKSTASTWALVVATQRTMLNFREHRQYSVLTWYYSVFNIEVKTEYNTKITCNVETLLYW